LAIRPRGADGRTRTEQARRFELRRYANSHHIRTNEKPSISGGPQVKSDDDYLDAALPFTQRRVAQ